MQGRRIIPAALFLLIATQIQPVFKDVHGMLTPNASAGRLLFLGQAGQVLLTLLPVR